MSNQGWCDFDRLAEVVTQQFRHDGHSVHGPSHWRRVEQNGLWLCRRNPADQLVVRLFAWFHDARRRMIIRTMATVVVARISLVRFVE